MPLGRSEVKVRVSGVESRLLRLGLRVYRVWGLRVLGLLGSCREWRCKSSNPKTLVRRNVVSGMLC